jgi:hypothetical protein
MPNDNTTETSSFYVTNDINRFEAGTWCVKYVSFHAFCHVLVFSANNSLFSVVVVVHFYKCYISLPYTQLKTFPVFRPQHVTTEGHLPVVSTCKLFDTAKELLYIVVVAHWIHFGSLHNVL